MYHRANSYKYQKQNRFPTGRPPTRPLLPSPFDLTREISRRVDVLVACRWSLSTKKRSNKTDRITRSKKSKKKKKKNEINRKNTFLNRRYIYIYIEEIKFQKRGGGGGGISSNDKSIRRPKLCDQLKPRISAINHTHGGWHVAVAGPRIDDS